MIFAGPAAELIVAYGAVATALLAIGAVMRPPVASLWRKYFAEPDLDRRTRSARKAVEDHEARMHPEDGD